MSCSKHLHLVFGRDRYAVCRSNLVQWSRAETSDSFKGVIYISLQYCKEVTVSLANLKYGYNNQRCQIAKLEHQYDNLAAGCVITHLSVQLLRDWIDKLTVWCAVLQVDAFPADVHA